MQENKTPGAGILILALEYWPYGRMAHNLAVSLKNANPEIQIALGWSGDALKDLFRYDLNKAFDHIIEVPQECYQQRGHFEYHKAKLSLLEITPFRDGTLLLDADMIWLGSDPVAFLKELEKSDFEIQNRGYAKITKKISTEQMWWADPNEIRDVYQLDSGRFYRVYSEVIWMKETETNILLMAAARDIHDSPNVSYVEFGGGVADELSLMIAMAVHQVYPGTKDWTPSYWENIEKKGLANKPTNLRLQNYKLLSIGGKTQPRSVKTQYDHLVDAAFYKAGLPYPYHCIDKKKILPLRNKK